MPYLNFIDWRPRRRWRRARACVLSALLLVALTTAVSLLWHWHTLQAWQQQQPRWQAYQRQQQQLAAARLKQQQRQQQRQLQQHWRQQQLSLLRLLASVNRAAGDSGAKLVKLAWQQQLSVTAQVDSPARGAAMQQQLQRLPLSVTLQHSQRQANAAGNADYRLHFQLDKPLAHGAG